MALSISKYQRVRINPTFQIVIPLMSKHGMTVHISETSWSLRNSRPKTSLALCINSKILKKRNTVETCFLSYSVLMTIHHLLSTWWLSESWNAGCPCNRTGSMLFPRAQAVTKAAQLPALSRVHRGCSCTFHEEKLTRLSGKSFILQGRTQLWNFLI